jgi:hypothetical protein
MELSLRNNASPNSINRIRISHDDNRCHDPWVIILIILIACPEYFCGRSKIFLEYLMSLVVAGAIILYNKAK